MATRWQGMGTKEASGYKEKIDTAWDDFYMGDKGRSSLRSDLWKALKVAGGLSLFNLYGNKKVEKHANKALKRANSAALDLAQQKVQFQNNLTEMSTVSSRENNIRKRGITNVQDDYEIMYEIIDEVAPDYIEDYKETYTKQDALAKVNVKEAGVSYLDPRIAIETLDDNIKERARTLFNHHKMLSKKYAEERVGSFLPQEDIIEEKDGKITVIESRSLGYMNRINAAQNYVLQTIDKIRLDANEMNAFDGIMLEFGIKKFDRNIIKTKAILRDSQNKVKEVFRKFSFEFPFSDLDEELESEVANRAAEGVFTLSDGTIKKASAITEQDRLQIIMSDEYQNIEDYKKYVSDIAINVLNKKQASVSLIGSLETVKGDAIRLQEGEDRLATMDSLYSDLDAKTKKLNLVLAKGSDSDTDEWSSSILEFDAAFDAIFAQEALDIKEGFGPSFYTRYGTELEISGTSAENNAQINFLRFYNDVMQMPLLPYQIVKLEQTKAMLFRNKNALYGTSLLPDSKSSTGFDPHSADNLTRSTDFMTDIFTKINLISSGNELEFISSFRPELDPDSAEFQSIFNDINNFKQQYIAMQTLLVDPVGGPASTTKLPFRDSFRTTISDVAKLYIEDDNILPGDAMKLATLDVLAKMQYVAATTPNWGVFKGKDIGKYEALALTALSASVIKGSGFRQVTSKITNKETGEQRTTTNLPIWTRILDPKSLATLKRASEGKPRIDILDKMVTELGTEKIEKLNELGNRFKNFYTGQGKYHPRTGSLPDFSKLEDSDKVKMLSRMTNEIMALDPSFDKRIRPFYNKIITNMVRSSKQPTGLWNYSQGLNDEVVLLADQLIQEFNYAQSIAERAGID
tara:strand:+ start:159 stop:2735 length:2577 start_codon:yes stop_codon:yes gene_type:complete